MWESVAVFASLIVIFLLLLAGFTIMLWAFIEKES
jgi:hypothetical protein